MVVVAVVALVIANSWCACQPVVGGYCITPSKNTSSCQHGPSMGRSFRSLIVHFCSFFLVPSPPSPWSSATVDPFLTHLLSEEVYSHQLQVLFIPHSHQLLSPKEDDKTLPCHQHSNFLCVDSILAVQYTANTLHSPHLCTSWLL